MKYYRLQYQGYIEDEFDNKEEAISALVDELHDVHETDFNIMVEVWNEETNEWESQ